ncbi:MAG: nitrous oxide reductase accessory protein NosL [Bryobacterales bacterium]|nr:nitrous oxide reductase accessory protein NosL [Bryobacterales bacterium]
MCGHCRMAISQKQFAAEVFDAAGNVVKFDDAGCMLRWLVRQEKQAVAIYAVDYDSREWLEARTAIYVRTERIATPMGGGILAFAGRTQAEAAAGKFGGVVVTFSELLRDKAEWNSRQSR